MRMLLYRPPERHHAYRWGVYVQLPNKKVWLLHYNNIVRGNGVNADEFREIMNRILKGEIIAVEGEWQVKVVKVLSFEELVVKKNERK